MKTWRRKSKCEQPSANRGGVCVELAFVTMQNGLKVPVVYPFEEKDAAFAQEWVAALTTAAVERKTTSASSS